MIGSDEVDPSHAQQIIINKEVVSLTFWLWHVIFSPTARSHNILLLPLSPVCSKNQNECDSLWKFQSVQSQLI